MTPLDHLIGDSPEIVSIRKQIERLLQRQSVVRRQPPILILGETGTGKGLVARAIHAAGPRAAGPLVEVNCAALPETLLEAELFGFERGAFTGARYAKPGLFQVANRGTIFLDEVSRLPVSLQAKLLKVVEERKLRRLGSTREEPMDAGILAASSDDLLTGMRHGRFREDLYHRLAVVSLWLPPLRQRGRDIVLLAERLLARACADYRVPPKMLTQSAQAALLAYPWPGNVRELGNLVERVAVLSDATQVTAETLGLRGIRAAEPTASLTPNRTASPEGVPDGSGRAHSPEAPRQTNWNINRATTRLELSREPDG